MITCVYVCVLENNHLYTHAFGTLSFFCFVLFNKCSQVAEMSGGVSALGNMCSSGSNIPGNRILHRQGLVCRGNSETVILVCE